MGYDGRIFLTKTDHGMESVSSITSQGGFVRVQVPVMSIHGFKELHHWIEDHYRGSGCSGWGWYEIVFPFSGLLDMVEDIKASLEKRPGAYWVIDDNDPKAYLFEYALEQLEPAIAFMKAQGEWSEWSDLVTYQADW